MITAEALTAIAPKIRQAAPWAQALNAASAEFNIETKERVALFLSQCAHESAGFNRLVENLDYTAERLMAVWPHEFKTLDDAKAVEHKPVALATRVYGGRLGNNTFGDGYRYRGRGLLQITFKYNYQVAARRLSVDLVSYPERLESQLLAARSAADFFAQHVTPQMSVEEATHAINGGAIGLESRLALYQIALAAL